jgi:hypothetical protein
MMSGAASLSNPQWRIPTERFSELYRATKRPADGQIRRDPAGCACGHGASAATPRARDGCPDPTRPALQAPGDHLSSEPSQQDNGRWAGQGDPEGAINHDLGVDRSSIESLRPLPGPTKFVALRPFEDGECLWNVGTGGAVPEDFSVRRADSFSATAKLMSWLSATPSASASWRASSRSEG